MSAYEWALTKIRPEPDGKTCVHCGEPLSGRRTVYCSNECVLEFYRLWSWEGIRNVVLARDHYECQLCGSKENLCVHHKKPVLKFPELVADLTNLITLCGTCHGLTRRKPVTPSEKLAEADPPPSTTLMDFTAVSLTKYH